ncbi:RRM domain-containing protein, partial [Durusdinium trenchii]
MVSFHLRSECAAHLTRVADVPSLQMSLKLTLPVHELLQALTDATKAQIQAPVPVVPGLVEPAPAPAVPGLVEPTPAPLVEPKSKSVPLAEPKSKSVPLAEPKSAPLVDPIGQWEKLEDGCIVRVSNVMKRLNAEDLKGLFEEVVGPVEKVQVQQSHALVTFAKEEDAQRLIERFDGAILELPERPGAKARAWPLQQGIFAQCLEEHLGPLDLCQLLRGPGFVTIFQSAVKRQLKKDTGYQIDFRGSFIK